MILGAIEISSRSVRFCVADVGSTSSARLTREPRPLPQMRINPAVRSIFDFDYADFELRDYQSHPRIAAPIAV